MRSIKKAKGTLALNLSLDLKLLYSISTTLNS